jgi:hypothetical protein
MPGKMGILGVVAILAFSTGCTMCCHPYDECGPVFNDSSGRSYCSNVRAGSILEGRDAPVESAASAEIIEESPQEVSPAPQPLPATKSEPRTLMTDTRKPGTTAAISKTPTNSRTGKHAGEYVNPKLRRR